jgi:hypothetical protein
MSKINYAELCDVLRIKINAARNPAANAPRVGKFFSEPTVDVADNGSHVGDPRSAMQRRTADIDGAYLRGTVKIPVQGAKGRIKLTEAPGTEENVRKALDYWRTRKPRTDASRQAQNDNVSSLVRRLDAMRKAEVVVHAPVDAPVTTVVATVRDPHATTMGAKVSPEGLTRHMLAGPAIVQGPNMAATRPTWRNPATDEVEPAAAYLDGSLTERLDRTVADRPEKAHRSASQRSNWRKKQRRQRAKGQS